jgi:tricorn protease-like protein
LQNAFAESANGYLQKTLLNPHGVKMSLFHKGRNQRVFIGSMDGLMIVEDLEKGSRHPYRIEIPGGGYFRLNIFWGRNRKILYADTGEELVEIDLKTSQRRTLLAYNDIGPEVRMRFGKEGERALLWLGEEKVRIYLIDLRTLQKKEIASIEEEALEDFTFDPYQKYLLLTYRDGKRKRVRLP